MLFWIPQSRYQALTSQGDYGWHLIAQGQIRKEAIRGGINGACQITLAVIVDIIYNTSPWTAHWQNLEKPKMAGCFSNVFYCIWHCYTSLIFVVSCIRNTKYILSRHREHDRCVPINKTSVYFTQLMFAVLWSCHHVSFMIIIVVSGPPTLGERWPVLTSYFGSPFGFFQQIFAVC